MRELAGRPLRLTINGLSFDPDSKQEARLYNTITIPKGATYADLFGKDGAYMALLRSVMGEVRLSDGSRVRNARKSKRALLVTSITLEPNYDAEDAYPMDQG